MAGKKYWIAGYPDSSTTQEGATIASNFFSDSNKEGANKLIDVGQAIKDVVVNGPKVEVLLSQSPVNDSSGTIEDSVSGSPAGVYRDAVLFIFSVLRSNNLSSRN